MTKKELKVGSMKYNLLFGMKSSFPCHPEPVEGKGRWIPTKGWETEGMI
ncbi:hypothetical protein [Flagellimonas sp.]